MLTEKSKERTIGFGFTPAPRAAYHYVVFIPRDEEGVVTVSEHFVYNEDVEEAAERARFAEEPLPYPIRPPQAKVSVSVYKWRRVADDLKADFNRRLRTAGLRVSAWKTGENRVAAHLGKELVLLLWAIEDADPTFIPNAVANWQGLAPEERWWLYTTINAASGHAVEGRGRGWRKAIGIAFTENPVTQRPYFSQAVAVPPVSAASANSSTTEGKRRKGKRAEADDQAPTLEFDDI